MATTAVRMRIRLMAAVVLLLMMEAMVMVMIVMRARSVGMEVTDRAQNMARRMPGCTGEEETG